ncbi:MAG: coiled-coil protein [Candidatus Bathyarchaeia archaeon]
MTEQKTTEIATVNQQIEAIHKRIGSLKDDLNKTHEDIKKHIEQRDQLNEKAKTLRQEIADIKKERDQLNVSVKALKAQRDEVRTQMAPFIETIKEHTQKIRELREKRTGQNRQALQKAFDALEFKIATTSMDLHEERKLIDQVKEIEIQLSVYKKIDQHNKKINELKNQLKVYQQKADAFHSQLTENAKKSQDLHAKMLAKFEEMKKIREDATNLHLQFLLAKERIKPLHEEIGKCIEQRQKLFGIRQGQYVERQKQFEAAKAETERQKKAKEQEIKEKMGSAVREKLQRGEKLDWREFQLLAGDDTETED